MASSYRVYGTDCRGAEHLYRFDDLIEALFFYQRFQALVPYALLLRVEVRSARD